jgi:hypothetical protein
MSLWHLVRIRQLSRIPPEHAIRNKSHLISVFLTVAHAIICAMTKAERTVACYPAVDVEKT